MLVEGNKMVDIDKEQRSVFLNYIKIYLACIWVTVTIGDASHASNKKWLNWKTAYWEYLTNFSKYLLPNFLVLWI